MGSWATLTAEEREEFRFLISLPGFKTYILHFLPAWTEAHSMISLTLVDTQVRERQEPVLPGISPGIITVPQSPWSCCCLSF